MHRKWGKQPNSYTHYLEIQWEIFLFSWNSTTNSLLVQVMSSCTQATLQLQLKALPNSTLRLQLEEINSIKPRWVQEFPFSKSTAIKVFLRFYWWFFLDSNRKKRQKVVTFGGYPPFYYGYYLCLYPLLKRWTSNLIFFLFITI